MKKVLVASQVDEIAKTFLIQQGFQVLENNQETDNCFDENPEVEAVLLMPIKLDDNAMNKIDNSFLRCHKSYAVNLKYISDFSKCKISLTNGNYIPVILEIK